MRAAFALTAWGQKKAVAPVSQERPRFDAFEAMIARDWDRFFRYAYRLCNGNAEDAEDLLSESLIDAFRAFDRYQGEGFDRWVFRMIVNNRVDMARRAKVRQAESLETAFAGENGHREREIADERHSPEKCIVTPIYSEPLQKALDALSDEFRAVILLCDVEQMDYQEIADTLHIPLGTVRSRVHRARQQMRKTMESLGWRN